MTGDWMVGPLHEWISRPMRSAGALLIVFLFLYCRPVASWAGRRSLQWLGRISFSLYLIHEPIVVSLDRLLPGDNPWEVLLIALPLSLLVAAGFYRLVEAPSLRVARWAGQGRGPAVPILDRDLMDNPRHVESHDPDPEYSPRLIFRSGGWSPDTTPAVGRSSCPTAGRRTP